MKITLKTSVSGMHPVRQGYMIEFDFQDAHGQVEDPPVALTAKEADANLTLRLRSLVANQLPFGKKFKITIESCDDELGAGEIKP